MRLRSIWRFVEWAIFGSSLGLVLSFDSFVFRGIWRGYVFFLIRFVGVVVIGSNLILSFLVVYYFVLF